MKTQDHTPAAVSPSPKRLSACLDILLKDEWFLSRPSELRSFILLYPMYYEYRLKSTRQPCHLYSYSENNTMTVSIIKDGREEMPSPMPANEGAYSHQVFGIHGHDLLMRGLRADFLEDNGIGY